MPHGKRLKITGRKRRRGSEWDEEEEGKPMNWHHRGNDVDSDTGDADINHLAYFLKLKGKRRKGQDRGPMEEELNIRRKNIGIGSKLVAAFITERGERSCRSAKQAPQENLDRQSKGKRNIRIHRKTTTIGENRKNIFKAERGEEREQLERGGEKPRKSDNLRRKRNM